MRVIYVNLHRNGFFGPKLEQIIKKQHPMPKHRYLLNYLLAHDVVIADYVTIQATALPKALARHITNLSYIKAEAKCVIKKMGLPLDRIEIISDPADIQKDDIVIYYPTFENPGTFDTIAEVHGIKIMDHIHFYGEKERAEQLKGQNVNYFMFEVDLRKYSKMFQKNYTWFEGEYITRPYTYQPRFCVKTSFSQRKTKAVAMGTVTKRHTPEFMDVNGTDCYQPRRRMIMENAKDYPDEIDSYISEFDEKPLKVIHEKDLLPVKFYKKMTNFFQSGQQKNYFSFDMVEKYNEYKMFICPEDIHGSYGVGMVEGMACGCALIGVKYGGYEDIGLVAGESYIAYDGTMEDLIEKIRYYQEPENQAELEQIAQTGCEYIRKNFSEEAAAKQYYETLKAIIEKHHIEKED